MAGVDEEFRSFICTHTHAFIPELSMGWVDPWVELGWVEIFQFLVGWVGSTTAKLLKI